MQTVSYRLITIVAERPLRDKLIDAVHQLGATGHTLTDVKGEGARKHGLGMPGVSAVKIEAVVAPDVADRIASHVADRYFAHHSVIVTLQDVEVLRGSKYAPHNDEA